eukprot:scaffold1116_cov66-Cylindrotheca_fusiformis.AAC.1
MASNTSEQSSSSRSSNSALFYRIHNARRSSLLLHPDGLKLMEEYTSLMKNFPSELKTLAASLKRQLGDLLTKKGKETDISSTLRTFLKEELPEQPAFTVTGETEEYCKGTLDNEEVSGCPVIVVRKDKFAVMIIEISVDGKSGERKVGQAFDYLIRKPNHTILLFRLHFDHSPHLKISEEAFLYRHAKSEAKRNKFGFLWREVYAMDDLNCDESSAAFEGIIRSVHCSARILGVARDDSEWIVVSDSVVIDKKNQKVYKIFDNRLRATYRRPDVWLNSNLPCISALHVESVRFNESDDIAVLGKPEARQKVVPYPKGSVVVIRYDYLDGTHFASNASHFQQIAESLAAMHAAGIIHGDVRGFNMLHPHPNPKDGQIIKSRLIEFDLSGSSQQVYPPGYKEHVKDNVMDRLGRPGKRLEKNHDCHDLGSAMSHYRIENAIEAWDSLCKSVRGCKNGHDATELIQKFINENGGDRRDVGITVSPHSREDWEGMLAKGTGSPNKMMQTPRGPARAVAPSSASKRTEPLATVSE